MCDIHSDAHLTFGVNRMVRNATRMFKRHNPTLTSWRVKKFVKDILKTDTKQNTYHNLTHTYEVLQMTTHLLGFVPKGYFTPTEHTLIQVAALCHDYGHEGTPNHEWDDDSIHNRLNSVSSTEICDFLDDYNYRSYNELMHIEMTMEIIANHKTALFGNYSDRAFKKVITKLILSTDLDVHDKYMDTYIKNSGKIGVMILIIKLADVSHILQPFHVHLQWVYRIKNETKSDEMDIQRLAHDTMWFANTFVTPMLTQFVKQFPSAKCMFERLEINMEIWKEYS